MTGVREHALVQTAARVLVVDDEVHEREGLAELLEAIGCKVRAAGDVKSAVRELERFGPHVVVTDLVRGRLPLATVGLLARSLWRDHPITRHDSVVSIRAAFTASEAAGLARDAGLHEVRIQRHPFFRFSLVARPGRPE